MADVDTLPCGRPMKRTEDGRDVILLPSQAGGDQVIEKKYYCLACQQAFILGRIIAHREGKDAEEARAHLAEYLSVLGPDPPAPLPECRQILPHAVRADIYRDIPLTNDAIATLAHTIHTFGFAQVLIFLAFYANESALGAEWITLIVQEFSEQVKRLREIPGYVSQDSPAYTTAMFILENAPLEIMGEGGGDETWGESARVPGTEISAPLQKKRPSDGDIMFQ